LEAWCGLVAWDLGYWWRLWTPGCLNAFYLQVLGRRLVLGRLV
jgi:hypothetical protein